eukprot:scaffold35084_cov69-Phaeocystis_antarctica.AAC.1
MRPAAAAAVGRRRGAASQKSRCPRRRARGASARSRCARPASRLAASRRAAAGARSWRRPEARTCRARGRKSVCATARPTGSTAAPRSTGRAPRWHACRRRLRNR